MPFELLPTLAIDLDDFNYFRKVIRDLAGIVLSDSKKELLQSRLRTRVHALQLKSFQEYRFYLEHLPEEHPEWQEFINLLTTNKTDWFREPAHFNYLIHEYIPHLLNQRKKKISVWSAACSTGEEPYTIAMVLQNVLGNSASFEILGTDLDTEVLQVAQNGVYQKTRLEQIPQTYHDHISIGTGEISDWMKVKKEIKQRVSFRQFNLSQGRSPWKSQFDIIFCRNVLIYFPKDVIAHVIETLYQAAAPGALLVIGHSESLQNIPISWTYYKPSLFIKEP